MTAAFFFLIVPRGMELNESTLSKSLQITLIPVFLRKTMSLLKLQKLFRLLCCLCSCFAVMAQVSGDLGSAGFMVGLGEL